MTTENGEHHITIPAHNPLKVGIVSAILGDVAIHVKITKETSESLKRYSFGRRTAWLRPFSNILAISIKNPPLKQMIYTLVYIWI